MFGWFCFSFCHIFGIVRLHLYTVVFNLFCWFSIVFFLLLIDTLSTAHYWGYNSLTTNLIAGHRFSANAGSVLAFARQCMCLSVKLYHSKIKMWEIIHYVVPISFASEQCNFVGIYNYHNTIIIFISHNRATYKLIFV